jgi:hypothetical protein
MEEDEDVEDEPIPEKGLFNESYFAKLCSRGRTVPFHLPQQTDVQGASRKVSGDIADQQAVDVDETQPIPHWHKKQEQVCSVYNKKRLWTKDRMERHAMACMQKEGLNTSKDKFEQICSVCSKKLVCTKYSMQRHEATCAQKIEKMGKKFEQMCCVCSMKHVCSKFAMLRHEKSCKTVKHKMCQLDHEHQNVNISFEDYKSALDYVYGKGLDGEFRNGRQCGELCLRY